MVPFAGYSMPLRFAGIVAEHQAARVRAALFDVSHMGQLVLAGEGRIATAEGLLPIAAGKLAAGRSKYTFMCDEQGGTIDDMIVGNDGDRLFIVCNAASADAVAKHIEGNLADGCTFQRLAGRALLALQGPQAAAVLAEHAAADLDSMYFMDALWTEVAGAEARICRCGYTGEDGFEISLAAEAAASVARALLADDRVAPAGLGARDSLRLEAGLCLYGNELSAAISPIEAGLRWAIPPSRRRGGGFVGADTILDQIANGTARCLVGLACEGRAPLRAGAELQDAEGQFAGTVTSGGWSPTLERPVALALVGSQHAHPGCRLSGLLRGRSIAAETVELPHVAHRYRVRPRAS